MMIEIPRILVHLRDLAPKHRAARSAMRALAWTFASRRRYERAQRLARAGAGRLGALGPLRGWTASRELPKVAERSFREWWDERGA